jgi:hypothetical protein
MKAGFFASGEAKMVSKRKLAGTLVGFSMRLTRSKGETHTHPIAVKSTS